MYNDVPHQLGGLTLGSHTTSMYNDVHHQLGMWRMHCKLAQVLQHCNHDGEIWQRDEFVREYIWDFSEKCRKGASPNCTWQFGLLPHI